MAPLETQGGVFHGRILLPSDYPFKPPSFMMQTVRHRPTYDVSQKSARSLQLHQTGTTFGPGRWFSCVETHTTSSHPLSPALTLSLLCLRFSLSLYSLSVVLFAFFFLFPAKIFLLNLKILLDKHVGELSDLPFDGHVDETRTVLTVLHDETTQQRLINFRL